MIESQLISHKTFERFCELKGFRARPILVAAKPRPDYKVWVGQRGCVVELKQLEPNPEDERQRLELEAKGQTTWKDLSPGSRVRNEVRKAARQLQPWARGGVPSLLVLFDNTISSLGIHSDPYAMKVGMYGLDAFLFGRPEDASQGVPIYPLGWVSGGKATMTGEHNTSFSAVGLLWPCHPDDPESAPYLVLYHNHLAAIPVDPECVAAVTEHQYCWADRRPGEVGCWVHAISGEQLE
jgi:hypothetical protein